MRLDFAERRLIPSANKCSELGACGALPPGEGRTILSVWAGGHVAPGPYAARTARRATSQSLNVSRHTPTDADRRE